MTYYNYIAITSSVVQVDRLEDGKIVKHWSLGDLLSVLQQLRGKALA
ncbi:MAG: ester cyclase [Chroococcidiopsis sp.]